MNNKEIESMFGDIGSDIKTKKYKSIQIEEAEADDFRTLAKSNNVTQTQLMRYLIKSTHELQDIKAMKGK